MITFLQDEAVFIYESIRFKGAGARTFSGGFDELVKFVGIFRKFKDNLATRKEDGQDIYYFKKEVKVDLNTEEKAAILEMIKGDAQGGLDVVQGNIALRVIEKIK